MSWLEAVFRSKKPTADDRPEALEHKAIDGDTLPKWMTETGLFRMVGQSPIARQEPWKPATIDDKPDPFASPLPQRVRKVSQ